jgi:hypothetical protein
MHSKIHGVASQVDCINSISKLLEEVNPTKWDERVLPGESLSSKNLSIDPLSPW